jgi:hypothetical protein
LTYNHILSTIKTKMSKKSLLVFLLFFLVSGCGLVASLILTKERQIVEKRAAGGQGAYLSLLPSLTVGNGQEFSLPVMLGTDGVEIIGVDVVLNFDKNFLELTDVIPGPDPRPNTYTYPFGTYLPVDNNGNFNVQAVKNSANSSGKIEIGAVAFNWASEQTTPGFNGTLDQTNPLFTLKFRAKQAGQTSVYFSPNPFTPGTTADSNLVRINGDQVQDILSQVTNLSITITSTTPTPTSGPTNTPTPTPRPTNTPTPTPTPTPRPTNTPTPTPRPTNTPTPTPQPTNTPTPTPQCTGNGDINLDGKVSEIDIMIILNNWSPTGPVPTPVPGYCSSDVNNDGRVSESDIMKVLLNWKPQ